MFTLVPGKAMGLLSVIIGLLEVSDRLVVGNRIAMFLINIEFNSTVHHRPYDARDEITHSSSVWKIVDRCIDVI